MVGRYRPGPEETARRRLEDITQSWNADHLLDPMAGVEVLPELIDPDTVQTHHAVVDGLPRVTVEFEVDDLSDLDLNTRWSTFNA